MMWDVRLVNVSRYSTVPWYWPVNVRLDQMFMPRVGLVSSAHASKTNVFSWLSGPSRKKEMAKNHRRAAESCVSERFLLLSVNLRAWIADSWAWYRFKLGSLMGFFFCIWKNCVVVRRTYWQRKIDENCPLSFVWQKFFLIFFFVCEGCGESTSELFLFYIFLVESSDFVKQPQEILCGYWTGKNVKWKKKAKLENQDFHDTKKTIWRKEHKQKKKKKKAEKLRSWMGLVIFSWIRN